MDKSAILKARVEEALHEDFLAICAAFERTPAAQLRDVVRGFVSENRTALEDPVIIRIHRPERYTYGAWRVHMRLREPSDMTHFEAAIPFELPQLSHRHIQPARGYAVGTPNWDQKGRGLSGIFVDGMWEGDLYSNGVGEAENPTSLSAVRDALKKTVVIQINACRGLD